MFYCLGESEVLSNFLLSCRTLLIGTQIGTKLFNLEHQKFIWQQYIRCVLTFYPAKSFCILQTSISFKPEPCRRICGGGRGHCMYQLAQSDGLIQRNSSDSSHIGTTPGHGCELQGRCCTKLLRVQLSDCIYLFSLCINSL